MADLYTKDDLTIVQCADRTGLSSSMVKTLLDEAGVATRKITWAAANKARVALAAQRRAANPAPKRARKPRYLAPKPAPRSTPRQERGSAFFSWELNNRITRKQPGQTVIVSPAQVDHAHRLVEEGVLVHIRQREYRIATRTPTSVKGRDTTDADREPAPSGL